MKSTLVSWNVYTGNDVDNVIQGVEELREVVKFDGIAIHEAKNFHEALKVYAKAHRMVMINEDAGKGIPDEHGNTVVLYQASVRLLSYRFAVMTRRWLGPKHDIEHQPRRFIRSRYKKGNQIFRASFSHWPTGGLLGRNGKAVAESMGRSRRWFKRSILKRPSVDIGDLNNTARELELWASDFGAKVQGFGPDNAVSRNVAVSVSKYPKNFGSDHHPLIVSMDSEGK